MGATANRGPGRQSADAFARRVMEIIDDGALALLVSIGHRTGLFDKLFDAGPLTSQEIAECANLIERYVREWLGAMVTGRIFSLIPLPAKGPTTGSPVNWFHRLLVRQSNISLLDR